MCGIEQLGKTFELSREGEGDVQESCHGITDQEVRVEQRNSRHVTFRIDFQTHFLSDAFSDRPSNYEDQRKLFFLSLVLIMSFEFHKFFT